MPDTKPKILLIRPTLDSEISAQALREKGYAPLISPLLEIEYLDDVEIEPAENYAFTSQNGARFFGRHVAYTSGKLFSVGTKTTGELEKAGFQKIETAQGNADSLLSLLLEKLPPDESLLHLSGDTLSLDIAAELRGKGYSARNQVVYKMQYIEELNGEALETLQKNDLFAVFLYSPKSAEAFKKATQNQSLKGVHGICLSDTILNEAQDLDWKSLSVSKEKTTESMIERLDQIRLSCQNEESEKIGSQP